MLRTLLFETKLEWDLLTGEILTAMNNRVSNVTGYTPFSAFYSRSFNLPSSMLEPIEDNIPVEIPMEKFVNTRALANKLRWKEINDRLDLIYNYDYYNQSKNLLVDDSPIKLHDWVYINVPRPGKTKLSLKFPGPYEIIEQLTPRSYKLRSMIDKHEIILHEDRIVRKAPFVRTDFLPSPNKQSGNTNTKTKLSKSAKQPSKVNRKLKTLTPNLYDLGEYVPPRFEAEIDVQNSDPLEDPPDFRIEENDRLLKLAKQRKKKKINLEIDSPNENKQEIEDEDHPAIDRPRRSLRPKVNYKQLHNIGRKF